MPFRPLCYLEGLEAPLSRTDSALVVRMYVILLTTWFWTSLFLIPFVKILRCPLYGSNKQLVVQFLLRDDSPEVTRVMAQFLTRIFEVKSGALWPE